MKKLLTGLLFAAGLTAPAFADLYTIINPDAHYPEGPVWYKGKLYYIEYDRNSADSWDGKTNKVVWAFKGCGQSAVLNTWNGNFVTTCYDNGSIGRFDAAGRTLPAYTHDKDGNKFVGPNDLAPDKKDGIYFTASRATRDQ